MVIGIILCNSLLGITITFVYKYADAIIKTFSTACATGVLLIFNLTLFHSYTTLTSFLGATVIFISSYIYFLSTIQLPEVKEEENPSKTLSPKSKSIIKWIIYLIKNTCYFQMKFGEYLRKNLTSEWSSQYIEYENLKEFLYEIGNKAPKNEILLRQQYFIENDQEFFQYCDQQLSKINTFFAEKIAQALLKFDVLKNELEYIEVNDQEHHLTYTNKLFLRNLSSNDEFIEENARKSKKFHSNRKWTKHRSMKLNDLKLALSEFYLMLILLKNYQTLNYNGFCKILKKHDKLFQLTTGYQWKLSFIDCTPFYQSSRVDQLIVEVENLYINKIEHGDRSRAMQRLRVPPLEEKQSAKVTFRLGIYIGMILILIPLLIIILFSFYIFNSSKIINWRAGLHLYRSSFLIIMHIIFFGINVYGWSTNGVNHILIFEIDPRNHLTYQIFLEIGTFLMVLWLISLNIFFVFFYFDYYPFIQPLIFTIFLIFFFINPLPIFYKKSRIWLLKKFFRVFLSPFYHVNFADFWLADQLCSLELVFFDLEFFICFYINGNNISSTSSSHTFFCSGWSQIVLQSFFLLLPSWFRFWQCIRRYRDTKQKFPHLVNAGKYASTLFVAVTNALRRAKNFDYHQHKLENPFLYLWILTSLISSTYKVIWDIKMDWGFFDVNAGENRYLREQIVYPKKIYYYISIIINVLLRYIWIINVFVYFNSLFGEYSDIIGFSFAFIEIFRRFLWNYFRLENEHLTNCGEYRAVRDISIRPTSSITNNLRRTEQTNIQVNSQINENDATITLNNEIPMMIINDPRRRSHSSLIRRKTNAEDFIDEINPILTINNNTNMSFDDDQTNSIC
ncbi:hypothetical protein I4U23_011526 [Adineta vaga]|nr:hypothetical protein I4U23_011526 [Adineta vaga]